MLRITTFIRRYFMPGTLEQTLGAGYLLFAISLTQRPFMAGIENLPTLFGQTLSVPAVGVWLAIVGGVLIYKRRCGWLLFTVCYAAIPIYAVCLALFSGSRPTAGHAGAAAYIALTLCLRSMYRRQAQDRKREAVQNGGAS